MLDPVANQNQMLDPVANQNQMPVCVCSEEDSAPFREVINGLRIHYRDYCGTHCCNYQPANQWQGVDLPFQMPAHFAHITPMVWCHRQHCLIPLRHIEQVNADGTIEYVGYDGEIVDLANEAPVFWTEIEHARWYVQMAADNITITAEDYEMSAEDDGDLMPLPERLGWHWRINNDMEIHNRVTAALNNMQANI